MIGNWDNRIMANPRRQVSGLHLQHLATKII